MGTVLPVVDDARERLAVAPVVPLLGGKASGRLPAWGGTGGRALG